MHLFSIVLQSSPNYASATAAGVYSIIFSMFFQMSQEEADNILQFS